MEYFSILLQRLLLFSLIFSAQLSFPPLACVALNESLKCKYINTKLLYLSHVQIGISGCILLPKELPSSRKLHKSQNFVLA